MLLRPAVVVIRRVVVALVLSVFVGVTAIAQTTPAFAATSWSSGVAISNVGEFATAPKVAVSAAGKIVVVWRATVSGTLTIQASTSDDQGASWSSPVALSTVRGYRADIAVDSSGNFGVVWQEDSTTDVIKFSSSSDGLTWTAGPDVSSAVDAQSPQIVVDGSDYFTVVYQQANIPTTVKAATGNVAGVPASWSQTTLSNPVNDASAPKIAADGSAIGVVMVVWLEEGTTNKKIWKEASANGSWQGSTSIDSVTGAAQRYLDITSFGDGDFAVIWQYSATTLTKSTTDLGANWNPTYTLDAGGQMTQYTAIEADGTNLVAAWGRSDGSNTLIEVSRSTDSGINWSTADIISEAGESANLGGIATDGSSKVAITWERLDGSVDRSQVATSEDGGVSWDAPVTSSQAGDDSAAASVSYVGSGVFLHMWSADDGTGTKRLQVSSSSSSASSSSSSSSSSGVPGIFLAVNGVLLGKQVEGAPVYYGADRVAVTSTYLLTVTSVSNVSPSVVTLAEGTIDTNGSFSSVVRLPNLAPGTYNVRMTGEHTNGATLELTSQVTIDAGVFTSIGANIPVIR